MFDSFVSLSAPYSSVSLIYDPKFKNRPLIDSLLYNHPIELKILRSIKNNSPFLNDLG